MIKGRRIAFDYGDVRIGVAISDVDGILAVPLVTLINKEETLFLQISELIDEYQPIHIYVGKPLHLSGKESDSTLKASAFATRLGDETSLPVTLIDERLSTVSAARALQEAGKNSKQARKMIDEVAAVGILEAALNAEKGKQ
jgi:putative holliday junction resolvase